MCTGMSYEASVELVNAYNTSLVSVELAKKANGNMH